MMMMMSCFVYMSGRKTSDVTQKMMMIRIIRIIRMRIINDNDDVHDDVHDEDND